MAPNPRTFFDLEREGAPLGRVVFELFADQPVPRTVENFRVLCNGSAGTSAVSGLPLSYEGSTFHRVIPQFMIQGGDFTKHNGTGGESIYGGTFADEDLSTPVDREGLLVMANRGKDTNGSQFFITLAAAPHLNGKHVVFGRVVSGFEHIQTIESLPTDAKDRPLTPITIARAGELQLAKKPVVEDRGRSVSRGRSESPARRKRDDDDSRSRSRSRSPSRERSSRRSKKARRSPSTSASSSSSRSRSPPRRSSKHKSSSKSKKAKKGSAAARVPPAEERRDARGIPLDRDETDAEIDARLEREDLERREQQKREREEALKRRLRDDEARERERASSGGVQYKGRGTMRYTEDRPTPDLPSYSRSYPSQRRGPPAHADRGFNSGTREREGANDRWAHDRATDSVADRTSVEDRFVRSRRAEADRQDVGLSEGAKALAGRIGGRSADDPEGDDAPAGNLPYEDEDEDDRPRRSASPPRAPAAGGLSIRGSAIAVGGVDEVHVSQEKKDEVRALEVGDIPAPAGGGMRSWD